MGWGTTSGSIARRFMTPPAPGCTGKSEKAGGFTMRWRNPGTSRCPSTSCWAVHRRCCYPRLPPFPRMFPNCCLPRWLRESVWPWLTTLRDRYRWSPTRSLPWWARSSRARGSPRAHSGITTGTTHSPTTTRCSTAALFFTDAMQSFPPPWSVNHGKKIFIWETFFRNCFHRCSRW